MALGHIKTLICEGCTLGVGRLTLFHSPAMVMPRFLPQKGKEVVSQAPVFQDELLVLRSVSPNMAPKILFIS